jgi:hypothetical protein
MREARVASPGGVGGLSAFGRGPDGVKLGKEKAPNAGAFVKRETRLELATLSLGS